MRPLRRIPVPPGPPGVTALVDPLLAALDGSGPAIAPTPTASATISATYVGQLVSAVRADDERAPLESDEVCLVLATSGSTGAPRGVLLTNAAVHALTAHVTAPDTRWIAALPLHSMGGFNVLLRALASGAPPIALPSIGGAGPFLPADFVSAVQATDTTDLRVSLVPAQLRRLLEDDAAIDALRACSQLLIGGGPLPAPVRDRAVELGIAVTTTYGATETSGGCVYDGHPLPDVRVSFTESGEVLLDGPMLAMGYRLEPVLTAERFTDRGYRTGDLGHLASDGRLVIDGRLDDVVVVNGINVSLGAIERIAEQVPGIRGCAAVAVPTDGGEPVLALAIVTDNADAADTIRVAVRDQLGGVAVPRRITVVTELPLSPNGKVDRRAVLAIVQGDATS